MCPCFSLFGECFNSQPPEGGWIGAAAAFRRPVCFNSQPPEGGWGSAQYTPAGGQSFNSQPPEGGWPAPADVEPLQDGFNSQPPEGGWRFVGLNPPPCPPFQLTAARRRLAGADSD